MNSSTRTKTAARGVSCAQMTSPRIWLCLAVLFVFATITVNAQTIVNPTTTTVQYLGNPNPQNTISAITAPLGGIVLKGGGISPITGQPIRHLWVDDATSGICRVDPDLDTPGPYIINLQTCPFKINGASITGGPMAYDPARNFLYFVDEQRASQGIMRIGFDPAGDGGNGLLNFDSVFVMAGNTTGARFGGGTTGCPLPGNPGLPSAAALSPLGDLWVGFKKSGSIVRFNSPGTASQTGFGTCAQFITPVATVAKNSIGLAWIGHDLWGGDGTGAFVMKAADTNCAVPPNGICTVGNANPALNITNTLAAIGVPVAVMGDQYYPAVNGNNLYFTLPPPANVAWAGNVSAPVNSAAQTLTITYHGVITPAAAPAIVNLNGVAVDATDPANIVVYSGDDYSGLGLLANGQWYQTCQGPPPVPAPAPAPSPYVLNCPTPPATAVPGIPLNVVGVAGNTSVSLSWSPAQANQPVTFYTVTNATASNGILVPPVVINSVPGGFPATSTVINGLVNGVTYTFTVTAGNILGSSAASAPSNNITPPGILVPPAPTACPGPAPCAVAGDTQAFVTFTVSNGNGGSPITSYTVTSTPGGLTVTVPPPVATSNTGTAVIGGLTNGTSYTFTVHATNAAGNSPEGPATNPVIPSAANLPVFAVALAGPTAVTLTPAQITYTLTVTNTSNFPIASATVNHTLNTIPATIAAAGATRSVLGSSAISTTSAHFLSIGQTVVVAGVADGTFNGTFTITDVPNPTTFVYSQIGFPASVSGGGTATGLPLANIMVAQPGQGTCTAGGAGVVSVSCALGSMAPLSSVTVNLIVQMQNQAITNTSVVSGTDQAGTALANATISKTTAPPAPVGQILSAAISVAGTPQSPNPNHGATNNITWVVSNTSQPAAANVVFTVTHSATMAINGFTVTINNGGIPACFVNGVGVACAAPGPIPAGATITYTTPVLGGSLKNGNKPPQTMTIIETTVEPIASPPSYTATGTVSFGPGGTDTLPFTKTVTINAK